MTVPADYTILQAAREVGIDIPTLCYLEGCEPDRFLPGCAWLRSRARGICRRPASTRWRRGLRCSPIRPRFSSCKVTLEFLLSNHERKCHGLSRNRNCELQTLSEELGIDEISYEGERKEHEIDDLSPPSSVITASAYSCRRCVSVCKNSSRLWRSSTPQSAASTPPLPPP